MFLTCTMLALVKYFVFHMLQEDRFKAKLLFFLQFLDFDGICIILKQSYTVLGMYLAYMTFTFGYFFVFYMLQVSIINDNS